MKLKHNKKRNTAFLFESLVREMTKAVVNKDSGKKQKVLFIIKEHFRKGTELSKELEIYKSVLSNESVEAKLAEKVILEAKTQHADIDKEKIFLEQSALINVVNKELSKDTFSNFVPNYKSLATLYQIFNTKLAPKKKVLLENSICEHISIKVEEQKAAAQVPSDKLVMNTFISKFNDAYSENLSEQQQSLLNKYVTSFADNGVELKLFLNEEIGRLRSTIKSSIATADFINDDMLQEKTSKLLEVIDDFKNKNIDPSLIKKVLKIQHLTEEITNNGN
tara:strand:+ start:8435 stop:9268 length:834 start_codon:yes stop_codon:yes gene_type:complete